MCSGSWGSITARGGSSRTREKVSWQCNQSRAEWINRRATQIDTPSCPKLLHPPPVLMLPQDTFFLPALSPWQPINKHFQVISAFSPKTQSPYSNSNLYGGLKTKNSLYKLTAKRKNATEDNDHRWAGSEADIQLRKSSRTHRESSTRNLYLLSMLSTWPCWLRCAYLGFHPPGDPSTWLHQTASKCREAGANPHKAVYLQCRTEWHSAAASFIKSHAFVRSWPDLGSRFELGLIGASWQVGWAYWGNVRLINM